MDNKTFVNNVVREAEIDKETYGVFLESFVGLLEDALSTGDTVSIPSFGNFEPRKRNERIMTNPAQPGKRFLVPPKLVANFKPSAILKSKINTEER